MRFIFKISGRGGRFAAKKDRSNIKSAVSIAEKIVHSQMQFLANAGHEVNVDVSEASASALNDFYGRDELLQ